MGNITRLAALLICVWGMTGCTGVDTFAQAVRAGDTIALAVGYNGDLRRDNISITFTPVQSHGPGGNIPVGDVITYEASDPGIRAVVNLYPDPISSLIVSDETGVNHTNVANSLTASIRSNATNGDKDYYQTTVYVDVPSNLPVGPIRVKIMQRSMAIIDAKLTVISTDGSPNRFTVNGGSLEYALPALERLPSDTIIFAGSKDVAAIQLELSHAPDITTDPQTGAPVDGAAYAVNPRGDIKNLVWSDDGTKMKVLLSKRKAGGHKKAIMDFKFYVAGGMADLEVIPGSLVAYDDGGTPISGVEAAVKRPAPEITSAFAYTNSIFFAGTNLCNFCDVATSDSDVWIEKTDGSWESVTSLVSVVNRENIILSGGQFDPPNIKSLWIETISGNHTFTNIDF